MPIPPISSGSFKTFRRRPALRRRAVLAAGALLFLNCVSVTPPPSMPLRFAVTGNTNPPSPFTGHAENLDGVIDEINRDNPVLLLHTGDHVRGGWKKQGIYEKDLLRQFRRLRGHYGRLFPLLYSAAGNRDSWEGSFDLYRRYLTDRLWYSFNCGNVHFVVLHVPSLKRRINPAMIRWLKTDLAMHRKHPAIFVISHRSLMPDPKCARAHPGGKALHDIFRMYPVKAVFSGSCRHFLETRVDGIRYIQAGCGGFAREDGQRQYNHYYLAVFDGQSLTIEPRRARQDRRRHSFPAR